MRLSECKFVKEKDIESFFLCKVVLSEKEVRLLTKTFNEVINGLYNVDCESTLGVSECRAVQYYSMLKEYRSMKCPCIEVVFPREAFVILQKAMIAVMLDFGCYPGDYSTRLGAELDEYLSLLAGLNSILEESCRLMCEEMDFNF
jgi:hypothetical protein